MQCELGRTDVLSFRLPHGVGPELLAGLWL